MTSQTMITDEIENDLKSNSAFSTLVPGLQLAVDSTSLGDFKLCPRLYFYREVYGWEPRGENAHITFGLLIHGARERYDILRSRGASHLVALEAVVDWALRATWNQELSRPWSSDHKTKNRLTLIRTIVWYLDSFGEEDSFETVIRHDGRPSVELSFTINPEVGTKSDEEMVLCGHMDRVANLNDSYYILDIKSTEHTLSPSYFSKFTPDNQFSMYALAGQIILDRPIDGIVVDAIQVAVGFSRFERQVIPRPPAILEEWLTETKIWLRRMEEAALARYWPMNDKACTMYGGCKFREVCSRVPGAREQWLKLNYKRRQWDPLKRRGDI